MGAESILQTEEFDKALRSYRAAERRYARGAGSVSTAWTMSIAKQKMEALLSQVDEKRRAQYAAIDH